jgi:hypothetical protein
MYRMRDAKSPGGTGHGRETFPAGAGHALDERTKAQVAELERLEALGVRCMEAFDAMVGRLEMARDIGIFIRPRNSVISEFIRLERAVRQTIILQRELKGLRPPRVVRPPRVRRRDAEDDTENDLRERPDTATRLDWPDSRDDWDKLDYRPVGEAIEWIRKTLGAEPPERDPFTPGSSGPPDSGPAPKPEPEPQKAVAARARKRRKPAPMGRLRARLFRTTHFSPPGPMAPPPGITRPAPPLWQNPRGPP